MFGEKICNVSHSIIILLFSLGITSSNEQMIFVEVYYGKLKVLKCDFAARQRSTRLCGKAVLDLDFQGFNRKLVCFFCFFLFLFLFCSFVNNLRIQGVYSAPLKHNMSCNLSKSR